MSMRAITPILRGSCGAALAVALLAVLPDVALACPVCFDGAGESRQAFIATTAFLTALPLGMIAGAGVWLRQRARRADEERFDSEPE
jgi:hypothetical protein